MGQPKAPTKFDKQVVALGRILQTLRELEDLEPLIEAVLEYVSAEFEYPFLWIGLYDRVNHQLQGQGGRSAAPIRLMHQMISLSPGDLMEQVVIQQRPLAVPDLRAESRAGTWAPIAEQQNIQGTLLFPIRHRHTCLGVMLLATEQWGMSPSASQRAVLALVLGALAEALYLHEQNQQQLKLKRADQPLLSLLEALEPLTHLEDRLKTVVQITHQFIAPSRTNIYWFAPQERFFWHRVAYHRTRPTIHTIESHPADSRIEVSQVKGFYQSLQANQLVVIGEAQTSLNTTVTSLLMQQLRARSLIAAPIRFQSELLGFISVEGEQARIWTEAERNYLQAAARLVGLAMPTAEMEAKVEEVKANQVLTATVSRSIHSHEDWRKTLDLCAKELCPRLQADQLMVLLYNSELAGFELCYYSRTQVSRFARTPWPPLSDVDWQMLERSQDAICIEDLEDELKLLAWQPILAEMKARSLIVCNVSMGHAPEGLLIVSSRHAHSWNQLDRSLVQVVSQQVGLILHQWQLQRQVSQQIQLYQTMQWGLQTIQRTFQLDQLEQGTLEYIAKLLRVPLIGLISWVADQPEARITCTVIKEKSFDLVTTATIPVASDAIVSWALQTEGLLPLTLEDLPDNSRQWLRAPTGSKLLAMALKTAPEHTCNAVLILADQSDRRWSEYHLNALTLLANQLAWSRRHLGLVEMLLIQRESLEALNWYKQKRFGEVHRLIEHSVRRLNELSVQKSTPSSPQYQQVLRQLGSLLTTLAPILKHEDWQLHSEYETTPLASLLNRLMERARTAIERQQLWAKVHNDNNLTIGGDIPKIEFILYELMAAACDRSAVGGRIDIWCRPHNRDWIEVAITDSGIIDDALIEELHSGRPEDLLAPSQLEDPPGLHFAICQALMQKMGGELNLFKLDDGRVLSRVILPIAHKNPARRVQIDGPTSKPFSRRQGR
ncbi:sensor histidine kinase [Almyronema epifaneia]|uniref:GAF domain-containing protein n=1 Tax=Almyronema epifaneia S1 TaxID=2991925 RepID=A0ABW6IEJ3_9CYAN